MNKVILDETKEIVPSKVVCIARNYSDHIKELKNTVPQEMVFFLKPNASISDSLIFPKKEVNCHYEAEISFLLFNNQIAAVGFGLDLTLRDRQAVLKDKGLPWERAKAFRKSAVFSKFVSFAQDLDGLEVELNINGELRQKGGVSLMLHKPLQVLQEASSFLDLEDGDILMTGTPSGVGAFQVGDRFLGRILNHGQPLVETSWDVL
ncbi:MAG: fumarylacetoacetate hydrolase family protein [Spirochaetota bacterium]